MKKTETALDTPTRFTAKVSASKGIAKFERITHTHTQPQVMKIPISMGHGSVCWPTEAPAKSYFIPTNQKTNKKAFTKMVQEKKKRTDEHPKKCYMQQIKALSKHIVIN